MNNDMPLVSIIVPVFNVENYLSECLKSILNQTYQNIEILAIDDGSTDRSISILNDFENKDERLTVLLHSKNKGQAAARNLGLAKSRGEFILFVDSDDFIDQNTVEKLVDVITKLNVDMVRFNAQSFSDEGERIREKEYNFNLFMKEHFVYKKEEFKSIYFSYSPSPVLYLFRSNILKESHLKFTESMIHEDELFSTLLFLAANSCAYLDENFYSRRYRKNSTMTTKTEAQKEYSFNSYFKILKQYQRILDTTDISKLDKLFLKYRINTIFSILTKIDIESNYKKEKVNEIESKKVYYSKMYKAYIRLVKVTLILKRKVGLK